MNEQFLKKCIIFIFQKLYQIDNIQEIIEGSY